MSGIIVWSAFGIFTVATTEAPLEDLDWTSVGMAAVNIVATSTLLTLPGTNEDDARRLANPEWLGMVADMQNASLFVMMAVQERDRSTLRRMSNLLADTCQTCHNRFRAPGPTSERDFAAR